MGRGDRVLRRGTGAILGALGDVADLLDNIGKTIIASLGRGIKDGFKDVNNFVSGIASKIASIKGPLEYDRKLLVAGGLAIMGGPERLASARPCPAWPATLADVTATVNRHEHRQPQAPPIAPAERSGPAVVIEQADLPRDRSTSTASWPGPPGTYQKSKL